MAGLRLAVRILGGRSFADASSGFRALSAPVLDFYALRYPTEHLGDSAEALLLACQAGFNVAEVPVRMRPRAGGAPSKGGAKLAYHYVRVLRQHDRRVACPADDGATARSPTPEPGDRRRRVRVVVVNFNGGGTTLACLDSVLATDWPEEDLQVVLVDNASDRRGGGRGQGLPVDAGTQVTVIEAGSNRGFAGGCNLALHDLSEVDYVALLNNDATVEPALAATPGGGYGGRSEHGRRLSQDPLHRVVRRRAARVVHRRPGPGRPAPLGGAPQRRPPRRAGRVRPHPDGRRVLGPGARPQRRGRVPVEQRGRPPAGAGPARRQPAPGAAAAGRRQPPHGGGAVRPGRGASCR